MKMVRTTSSFLNSRLGEPDHMEMDSVPNATIMRYILGWKCGCKAEGSGSDYVVRPCKQHERDLALTG